MSLRLQTGLCLLGIAFNLSCGDTASRAEVTPDIFAPAGEVMPRASKKQREIFDRGKAVALRRFAPEDGLGPRFNVVSCAGCHERPVTGGSAGHYRDFLLVGETLSDGSFIATGTNGVQDQYRTGGQPQREPSDPASNLSATRNPIAFFGTGLLAEIRDEEILRRADPEDADGDGIAGRPNYDRGFVGRFGRKAQTVSVEGFIRGPLFNHLGITTDPLSDELKRQLPVPSADSEERAQLDVLSELLLPVAHAQVAAPAEPNSDDDGVPDPEMSERDLFDLVAFSMLLAPLPPDPEPSEAAMRGHEAFRTLGCDGCHVEDLEGPGGVVPAYSDLLLHDMGEALDDGIVMGEATGHDFRTQPLWGVAATGPYLHDGRADTLDAAIRAHGGEGKRSRDAYVEASKRTRQDVVAFLESLGGRDVKSAGLIPPDAPIAKSGTPGSPRHTLSDGEQDRFLRGRAIFDRDMGAERGLGPTFNGDSCRACHFDPVPGGAGPGDVDVIRQAIAGEDTDPSLAPQDGTMAHRHGIDATRPPVDPESNVFERRQTPTLLGLGMLDDIDDSTLLGLEDPDDADEDGISGRAHVLSDGRVGKLGWKANVPSTLDFVHDAMTAEMGITLPAGKSDFGLARDDDEVPDPEISEKEVSDLTFFLRELSPPPRAEGFEDDRAVQRGEGLFDDVGCTDCHIPTLPTTEGDDIRLYSDLLLHDVAPDDYRGIPEGDAAPRELRTPPLWGLRDTAPYLHDGDASTIEQAIAAHESEAEQARRGYEALTDGQRENLLAFLEAL